MNGVAVASLVDRTILLVAEGTKLPELAAAIEGMQQGKPVSIVMMTGTPRRK